LNRSIVCSPDVVRARDDERPVVALESTIFSELGLPSPHNREALKRVWAAVAAVGALPALTAVVDGTIRCGVEVDLFDRICGPARKVAYRDLSVAMAHGWAYGATTVSATVAIAGRCDIPVFATGGIGGVHRGAERTGDVSADLDAIGRWPVVTVTAGAKVFLDLARTVEYLETRSVPVLGWRCDEFPAFHTRSSGVALAHSVETAEEVAAVARNHWALGGGGVVVASPVPEAQAIDRDELEQWVDQALADTGFAPGEVERGGADVTPAVLRRLSELSGSRTVHANLALAEHNASVAADIAVALAGTTMDRSSAAG
jgi:pseudouridine-5'-phosphate glycosidase